MSSSSRDIPPAPRPVVLEPERGAEPATVAPATAAHGRRLGPLLLLTLLLLVLAGMVYWGSSWLEARLSSVHETDARVVADMVTVSSRVEGWLTRVSVSEGDAVENGTPFAQVDDRAARLRVQELRAEIATLVAERERLTVEREVLEVQIQSRLRNQVSQLAAATALVDSLKHELEFARADHERSRKLSRGGVVSTKELDRTRTIFQRARQDLLRAEAEFSSARARRDEVLAERGELRVLEQQRTVLLEREKQYRARLARESLTVDDHAIVSPVTGVVSRKFVVSGEYVRAGQRVALIHDPDRIWVEANIRETQVARLRPGQRVRIAVDAYEGLELEGRVERIGHATTGEFALLPNPNPSGTFTKVTQRVPVRIAVVGDLPGARGKATAAAHSRTPGRATGPDSYAHLRLRPGMLVEVDIETDAPVAKN